MSHHTDDLDELVEKLKREPCAWCGCRHTPGPEHCLRGVVIVCGGRSYMDRARVYATMDKVMWRMEIQAVRHGAATGADTLADEWALERLLPTEPMPADWERHGRRAGPIRNRAMLDNGNVVMVVAFPGNEGTADMVRQAEARGIRVWKR